MGQEVFLWIEAGPGVEAGGIVEDVEQCLFFGLAWEPGVGTGIILPEGTEIACLPAFDRFAQGLETGVGSQVVGDGPTTDTGAGGFEIQAAMQFVGGGAVGAGRIGGEEFGQQGHDGLWPKRAVIATRSTGRPSVGLTVGASMEKGCMELVETGQAQFQFQCGCPCAEMAVAVGVEDVTDK
jgi:hypothetical protein